MVYLLCTGTTCPKQSLLQLSYPHSVGMSLPACYNVETDKPTLGALASMGTTCLPIHDSDSAHRRP